MNPPPQRLISNDSPPLPGIAAPQVVTSFDIAVRASAPVSAHRSVIILCGGKMLVTMDEVSSILLASAVVVGAMVNRADQRRQTGFRLGLRSTCPCTRVQEAIQNQGIAPSLAGEAD